MNLPFLLVIGAAVVTCGYSYTLFADGNEDLCPPPENIAPCTCFKAPVSERLTALCSNITDSYKIKAIFDKNPDWKLQDVHIDKSVMAYLPSGMLQDAHFQSLNVSSTTLVTLFDNTPVKTPELNLYLYDVKLLRGFEWKSIANSSLLDLGIWNMKIKSFARDFKENIPKGVVRLWFENTRVTSIKDQAFSHLRKLEVIGLRRGLLRKVSRNMFPRPSVLRAIDLSFQKLSSLEEDFFVDHPNLSVLFFMGNLLTTLSEKVFIKPDMFYAFNGNPINCSCKIKWIVGKLRAVEGTCSEPPSFKGKRLASLDASSFRFCQ